jgi:hypothetical protein
MASEALDPITNAEAWGVLRVGQTVNPGLALVGEVKRKYEWDKKKGKGTNGFTSTYVGLPAPEASVEFLLWTAAHFSEWAAFRPLFKYDPTKQNIQAIDVFHPAWADVDFKSVVVESIGSIVHKGKGLYSCTVEFSEYRPAPKKSAVSTPTHSETTKSGETTPGTQPDLIGDAQQAEIASLRQAAFP